MSHGDQLSAPPPGFHVIGHTKSAPFAAIAHNAKPLYGIQFHPEVTHSPRGKEVISRFVLNVCGCRTDWTMVSLCPLSQIADFFFSSSRSPPGRVYWKGDCSHPGNLRRIGSRYWRR